MSMGRGERECLYMCHCAPRCFLDEINLTRIRMGAAPRLKMQIIKSFLLRSLLALSDVYKQLDILWRNSEPNPLPANVVGELGDALQQILSDLDALLGMEISFKRTTARTHAMGLPIPKSHSYNLNMDPHTHHPFIHASYVLFSQ